MFFLSHKDRICSWALQLTLMNISQVPGAVSVGMCCKTWPQQADKVIFLPYVIDQTNFCNHLIFGNGPNMVLESTVSNTELSEFFWPSPSSGERAQ